MNSLATLYPSLGLFSDIDWNSIAEEFQTSYADLSFPEYLQLKAEEGDCPEYLFELAYYEYAKNELKNQKVNLKSPGIHLNPTAFFLSLEFDVFQMIESSKEGKIEIYERAHVLCLYKDQKNEIKTVELNANELELLESLENGPQKNDHFASKEQKPHFDHLVKIGLIICL